METIHQVYLALGSNVGDRAQHLREALEYLSPRVHLTSISPIYETAPWGFTDQPSFLNQVCAGETALPPLGLMDHLKAIEVRLGRQPTFLYGPRTIDLDILFYDNLVIDTPLLVIPHPRLHERAFVLVPLAQIAPQLRHPSRQRTISELLAQVSQTGVDRYEGGHP